MEQVAALLLAAGAGRRYGRPKGPEFARQAIAVLRDAGCAPIFVVVGAAQEQVSAIVEGSDAELVHNPDWADGIGSSLRAGLVALAESVQTAGIGSVCVHLVDLPGVTAVAVRRVLAAAGEGRLARACYDGAPGHPVLLGRRHWSAVASGMVGDRGARDYLRARSAQVELIECGDVADGGDIDFGPV